MRRLIVIEGLDGAGKRTMANALTEAFGGRVARLAFPRYGESVYADLVHEGLHGRLGGFGDEVYGMAMLYALDRHAAAPDIVAALSANDIVLLDRYVGSNAAFGAARLHQDAHGSFVEWVRALEIDRLGVPVPDAHVLLRVPVEVATSRSTHRSRTESNRELDTWESDSPLQARVAEVYDGLAKDDWLAPWHVVDGTSTTDYSALASVLSG